jgi:hypothetical protein
VESEVTVEKLPFSVEDAQRPESQEEPTEEEKAAPAFSRVLLDTRLNNRIIDLRVNLKRKSIISPSFYYVEHHEPCGVCDSGGRGQAVSRILGCAGFRGDSYAKDYLSGE